MKRGYTSRVGDWLPLPRMPVTRSTEIRDTTLNPTVTTDRGCTTGHNHTLSLSLPWAGTWHLQCSKLGVSTQSKGQISHLRARNVHRHECVTLAEFTEAPLLHVWRQGQLRLLGHRIWESQIQARRRIGILAVQPTSISKCT